MKNDNEEIDDNEQLDKDDSINQSESDAKLKETVNVSHRWFQPRHYSATL